MRLNLTDEQKAEAWEEDAELSDEQLMGISGGNRADGVCPLCGGDNYSYSSAHHGWLCKDCGWLD